MSQYLDCGSLQEAIEKSRLLTDELNQSEECSYKLKEIRPAGEKLQQRILDRRHK